MPHAVSRQTCCDSWGRRGVTVIREPSLGEPSGSGCWSTSWRRSREGEGSRDCSAPACHAALLAGWRWPWCWPPHSRQWLRCLVTSLPGCGHPGARDPLTMFCQRAPPRRPDSGSSPSLATGLRAMLGAGPGTCLSSGWCEPALWPAGARRAHPRARLLHAVTAEALVPSQCQAPLSRFWG